MDLKDHCGGAIEERLGRLSIVDKRAHAPRRRNFGSVARRDGTLSAYKKTGSLPPLIGEQVSLTCLRKQAVRPRLRSLVFSFSGSNDSGMVKCLEQPGASVAKNAKKILIDNIFIAIEAKDL